MCNIMGVGTGAAAVPIFLPIIKIGIYRKTEMKKRIKSLFSHATVLPNSQGSSSLTAIFAQGYKGLTVKD